MAPKEGRKRVDPEYIKREIGKIPMTKLKAMQRKLTGFTVIFL